MNTKAFYKLSAKRRQLEEMITDYDTTVKLYREESKKFKKGSTERQELTLKANDIINSLAYQKLKIELDILIYCINIMFYN